MVIQLLDRYWVATATAVGSRHRQTNAPNQDAVQIHASGSGFTVAVADGHGAPRHSRSEIGSRFAVEEACRLGDRLLLEGGIDPARFGTLLHNAWRSRIVDHLATYSVAAQDLGSPEPPRKVARLELYGTTLVVAVFETDRLFLAQIGDGDVVVVHEDGRVDLPLPRDPELIGNRTTSLCHPSAHLKFRYADLDTSTPPQLVLLSTDGYGNSFIDEKWQSQVAQDLVRHLSLGDLDRFQVSLEGWIAESAEIGGDDTTVALIFPYRSPPTRSRLARFLGNRSRTGRSSSFAEVGGT